ncbi:NUDIX hydrolase [Deinococcus peraridilitoris]|uniref:ADP-ribose pyrophosphatase n=1 Tax=Deinococcus peraridilitoris (strain DSM 19664 / LMG 22246 / CIP 109416 / KR-200) TaxID=937777 RepID=K9ZXK1_DEIPD|nr:ADP-ribose pyrophosphatase [Deinococcus peraridilitoris DSM 19664]
MNDVLPDPWRAWLGSRERQSLSLPKYRQAAVLVALTRETDPRVLLTVRSSELPTHRGQISFPGGRLETGESPLDAALREAWEEVGLHSADVEVVGQLDDAFTPIGFHVTPFLARIPSGYAYRSSGEVARILEPRLSELRALIPIEEERVLPSGERHLLYRYPWQGHDIWGMTARILHDIVQSGVS